VARLPHFRFADQLELVAVSLADLVQLRNVPLCSANIESRVDRDN